MTCKKELCILVDMANVDYNGFARKTDVCEYWDRQTPDAIAKTYKEYYGEPETMTYQANCYYDENDTICGWGVEGTDLMNGQVDWAFDDTPLTEPQAKAMAHCFNHFFAEDWPKDEALIQDLYQFVTTHA